MSMQRPAAAWRVIAGPESALYYVHDSRPTVAMWTADRSGRMKCGDIVLLYGTKTLQSYVAVARVCCDPRQNDRARRRKADRDWWVYLQVQPLRAPVARRDVEAQAFAREERSGLKVPRGGQANRVSGSALTGFQALLRQREPQASRRFDAWVSGSGRYPTTELDLDELRWADWSRPEVSTQEELQLSRRLAERLVKSEDFRYLARDDLPVAATRRDPDLSFEYRIDDDQGNGRVDVLLVDRRRPRPTLLAIEIKIQATLAPGRNPVPQIIRYEQALTAAHGNKWSVDTLVVAVRFGEAVITQAEERSLRYRHCSLATGRLDSPI